MTTLSFAVMTVTSTGISSSEKRNMNDEYTYVKLFLNDLNIPKLKVFPNTSIEEVNYQ
jgi:hypothetical protein